MNVTEEINKYIESKDTNLFANQFKLTSTSINKNKHDFYKNLTPINSPTTYNREPVNIENMYPHNHFDLFKGKPEFLSNMSNRRDNTVVINDFEPNITGQYALPKKEIPFLFEPMKNDNALAGFTKYVDSIDLSRFSQSLQYKNNDYLSNTNIRPESIDGTPMTELTRPREKTLEQLRGKGINSQRLDPKGRTNDTATIGEGKSLDPNNVNLTKFKIKSYRDQTNEDYLKTTGAYLKPEWQSMVEEPHTNRTISRPVQGHAKMLESTGENRNNQSARPTQIEDYITSQYISNYKSNVDYGETRNNQSARPTQIEDFIETNYVSNTRSNVDANTFRNNQSSQPTNRDDGTNYISNTRSYVDTNTYRNNQSLLPTNRDDGTNYISNTRSNVDTNTFRNNQSSQPTNRDDGTNYISNIRSNVDTNTFRNNQSSQPTNREEISNITGPSYNNNQSNIYINNQSSNPTIRDETSNNNITGPSYNNNKSNMYINNQSSNPTIRNETSSNNITGPSYNSNQSSIYYNNQATNPTQREKFTEYTGTSYSYTKGNATHPSDNTRSGVVEEVLGKDYMGVNAALVQKGETHKYLSNIQVNSTIEESINLTNRKIAGGGTDQLSAGVNEIGLFSNSMKRDKNNITSINPKRMVSNNYVNEIPNTRGKLLLQGRNNVNTTLNLSLNGNPYVNNMVHQSKSNVDNVYVSTNMNDRRQGVKTL
jgi:hypothetical protein